jgi:Spy/CpxP family protein refolding chaperone
MPADYHRLTDAQWQQFRSQMEAAAEGNERSQFKLNPVELAEMVLLLMDRIDHLEKRLDDHAA